MKKGLKKIGAFLKRNINGTKGAISLLLAFVMTPILSIALLLVESARYQHAVELMNELSGNSAFSTLANYDKTLENRFGVMAVSQDTDISETFSGYMELNVEMLGKEVDLNSATAKGNFALSNTKVLKQQILEYSELSVVAEVLSEAFDVNELIKKLREALNLKDLNKEIEKVKAGIDLAKEVTALVKAIGEFPGKYDKYKDAYTEYKDAYTDFKDDVLDLAEELADAEEKLDEDDDPSSIYDKWGVKNAIKDAKKSRDTYKKKNEALQKKMQEADEALTNILSSAESMSTKIQSYKDKTNNSKVSVTSAYEWINTIAQQVISSVKSVKTNSNSVTKEIQKLKDQVGTLDKFSDRTTKSSWTEDTLKDKGYKYITITSLPTSLKTTLENLAKQLDEKNATSNDENMKMGDILDILSEIMNIQALYNEALNSKVSSSALYGTTSLSYSDQATIMSLTAMSDACNNFKESVKKKKVLKALEAMVDLLEAVATFLAAVVLWITDTLGGIINMVAGGLPEMYNKFIMYGYGVYNMPNRTTFTTGSTVSGYKYNSSFQLAGGDAGKVKNMAGTFSSLSGEKDASGKDTMFKGAVTEYLLVGGNSERMNQSVCFVKVYLLRLALDLYHVLTDESVSALAALAGPGAILVKIVIAMLEPLLDTIILVNGGKEFLWKPTIYFSYKGLVILMNDITGITGFSENVKNQMKKFIKNHNGSPKEEGLFDATYSEHLLLLMIAVPESEYWLRLKNVIQMEGKTKYGKDNFSLDKAYTYVYGTVNYDLNAMFTLEGLTDNGAFQGKINKYVGY